MKLKDIIIALVLAVILFILGNKIWVSYLDYREKEQQKQDECLL